MADFIDPRVTEKRFLAIPPQQLTADGTTDGLITISNTYAFKVGQIVTIVSNAVQPRRLKIKAVPSDTEIRLGPIDQPIYKFSNVSDLLVADNAMVELVDDSINSGSQASNRRYTVDPWEQWRQVYEEEPTVALRSHLVDWLGRSYDVTNPMPVQLSQGSVNIGSVNAELEVQLSHQDNVPNAGDVADSVQVGNGTNILQIEPDGSINANVTINPANNPDVVRISAPLADTEYSYTFTTETKRYRFRVEDDSAKARIAWTAGETADDQNYWTVNRGSYYEDNGIDASNGITLYFQVNKANQTIQIQFWEQI